MRLNFVYGFAIFYLFSNMTHGSNIESTIKYGNQLTEAIQQKEKVKLKKLPEYRDIKKYLSANKCPGFKYKGYIVGAEDQQFFYLVATKANDVIIGRHFKAPVNNGLIEISKFQSSTNGCLNLGNPKTSDTAAMYATHLKPLPNEFHLLQSNLHKIKLYIGTSNGMYTIKNGNIELPKEN